MKVTEETNSSIAVAQNVSGEDIKEGDFVTARSEVVEWPSFYWDCSSIELPPHEPVRTRYITSESGRPFKVMAVCLPFIYAEQPDGGIKTFDVRKHQMVRLQFNRAQEVWKKMGYSPDEKKREAKKGKKRAK